MTVQIAILNVEAVCCMKIFQDGAQENQVCHNLTSK